MSVSSGVSVVRSIITTACLSSAFSASPTLPGLPLTVWANLSPFMTWTRSIFWPLTSVFIPRRNLSGAAYSTSVATASFMPNTVIVPVPLDDEVPNALSAASPPCAVTALRTTAAASGASWAEATPARSMNANARVDRMGTLLEGGVVPIVVTAERSASAPRTPTCPWHMRAP